MAEQRECVEDDAAQDRRPGSAARSCEGREAERVQPEEQDHRAMHDLTNHAGIAAGRVVHHREHCPRRREDQRHAADPLICTHHVLPLCSPVVSAHGFREKGAGSGGGQTSHIVREA